MKSKEKKNKKVFLFCGIVISILFSGLFTWTVYKTQSYPLGNDVYGHLFKVEQLYHSIKEGVWFPLYTENWYSGIELFRYWPPLSYYVCTAFMFVTDDVYIAYLFFLFFSCFLGCLGWVVFGYTTNSISKGIVFGLLYTILPDNMRVMFGEGNMPRIFITALLPLFFVFFYHAFFRNRRGCLIGMSFITICIVISHIMISAMLGISVFLFCLVYALCNKEIKKEFYILCYMVTGYLAAGIILLPGLLGGIVTQNSSASKNTSGAMWSEKLFVSLNPFMRMSDLGRFYFGLSLFIIILLGITVARKRTFPYFATALIIVIGTTMIVLPIISALPLSQVFWMTRFVPMAECFFIMGIFEWKELKRPVYILFLWLIFIDAILSFRFFAQNDTLREREQKKEETYFIDEAIAATDSRIAFMDKSNIGSYTSYAISKGCNVRSIFGWSYQGAYTVKEIVQLNQAFQDGFYYYVFDRLIYYGCDTVVIKKDETHGDLDVLKEAARLNGYSLIKENDSAMFFDNIIDFEYGVEDHIENVCIGVGSEAISYLYPSFYRLSKDNLDDYTYDELKRYKKIYISGPDYKNKKYCEDLVLKLSQAGVKVYVDMNNLAEERSKGRNSFLGVVAQPITFTNVFPIIENNSGERFGLSVKTNDYREWRTVYFTNLKDVTRKAEYQKGKYLAYLGTSPDRNITFIGFNLVFYCADNPQSNGKLYGFLDEVFEESRTETPKKIIKRVSSQLDRKSLVLKTDSNNVITSYSNLTSFRSDKDLGLETFIRLDQGETNITFTYPYLKEGFFLMVCGIIANVVLYFVYGGLFYEKREKK